MACLNVYKNDQQGLHATMGPRISFSNDFGDTQQPIKHDHSYREAPVSSDFEFSVSGNNMISADEAFFNGKILPAKTTLRDELLVEDDYMDVSPRQTKGMSRWKERLGLKKCNIHHLRRKSGDHHNVSEALERIDETSTSMSFQFQENIYAAKP